MKRKCNALMMIALMIMLMATLFVSCKPTEEPPADDKEAAEETDTNDTQPENEDGSLAVVDMNKWQYNKRDDVFYQIGIPYCSKPADEAIETLSVFVPGSYMGGRKNDDGTYSCEIRSKVKVKGYTAKTAPIIVSADTVSFKEQTPYTEYEDCTPYTKRGFIYVHPGIRGKEAGAPAGLIDIKAAVRYLRYSAETIPGDEESIFMFGLSAGGCQAAAIGASGDSSLYEPYLKGIGAVMDTSDAIKGVMAWSPVTELDIADAAYEWMMGSTRTDLEEDEQKISDGLAESFASYINSAGLLNSDGIRLSLRESSEGIYQEGTYHDHMIAVVQKSLNNFLKDTQFPYKTDEVTPGGLDLKGTYDTPKDYIKALNSDGKWVKYNSKKNRVTVTDLSEFVRLFKPATKGLGAFDNIEMSEETQTSENILFGYGEEGSSHFDVYLAEILNKFNNAKTGDFVSDLAKEDKAGNNVDTRVEMYSPLYFLLSSQSGYKKGKVAEYWRIRSGIEQTNCSLSAEVDLTLALRNFEGVKKVDFAEVWGQGHVRAERNGRAMTNFFKWVNECMK